VANRTRLDEQEPRTRKTRKSNGPDHRITRLTANPTKRSEFANSLANLQPTFTPTSSREMQMLRHVYLKC